MKRSDIRNAYDQMTPTREQKDRMLTAILEKENGKKRGKYQTRSMKTHVWGWIPAVAALIALTLIAAQLLPSRGGEVEISATEIESESPKNFFDSGLYKANVEWNAYMQKHADEIEGAMYSSENGIYNEFYCVDEAMRNDLDALCEEYGLTLPGEEVIVNDFDQLLEKMELDSVFRLAEGIDFNMENWGSSYYFDGTYWFGGTTTMSYDGSPWNEPVEYVLTYIVKPLFHENLLSIGDISQYTCWEYTTEDGIDVLLASEEEKSLLLADMGSSLILVEIMNYSGDTALPTGEEALAAFAETFDFASIANGRRNVPVETIIHAGKTVNIYNTPTTDSSVVGQLEAGSTVKIKQKVHTKDELWLLIDDGWILGSDVELLSDNPDDALETTTDDSLEDHETVEYYMLTIEKYKTALLENWTWEQCDQADISRQIMYDSAIKQDLGWCLLDIDKNGVEELIVSDGVHLFDLYTLMPTDGMPGHILSGNPYHYTLCKDGTIERRMSNGDFSYWTWLRFSEVDYVEEQKLILDNTIHRYYLGVEKENSRTITENEAGEYLTSDEKAAMELTLVPFVEMEDQTIREPNYYYEPIIETYRKAIVESWDPGKCMENGISLMIGYYGDQYDELGHNQIDLNGDGNAELIITDGTNIYDLYTVIHDETDGALRLIDATERTQYVMIDDELIYCRGSSGAALTSYMLYSVGERSLRAEKGYLFDATEDPGNPWFTYDGESKGIPCNSEDVKTVLNSWEPVTIPFIPFGDGGHVPSSEQSEWEKAKQTAFDIIESGGEFGYAEYIAWLIPWRNQEFENPRPLYYYLYDCNKDDIADLVLGYEDEVTAVWSYLYAEKAKEEHLTLLNLSEEEWAELDASWPSWDIRLIEDFLRDE